MNIYKTAYTNDKLEFVDQGDITMISNNSDYCDATFSKDKKYSIILASLCNYY